jgi:hypothetical protein
MRKSPRPLRLRRVEESNTELTIITLHNLDNYRVSQPTLVLTIATEAARTEEDAKNCG